LATLRHLATTDKVQLTIEAISLLLSWHRTGGRRSGGTTLQRLHQTLRRDRRLNQKMNMICHNHPGSRRVMSQVDPFVDGIHHHARNLGLSEVHRSAGQSIQLSVKPDKSLSRSQRTAWNPQRGGYAAMKMPGEK